MSEQGPNLIDAIMAGLAVLAVAEIIASRYAARRQTSDGRARNRLVASLLFWEGVAILACVGVIYVRRDIFDIATIVSLVAVWMAGAAVGLLRAGVFDPPTD